ncbi:MAG: hypothetical protein GC138_06775 [Gammaproteobacteria bacterium]|nr:hypothetical protein [Gammaproteobacteria bacterium]
MAVTVKAMFSAVAVALTFAAFIPYIRSIWQGRTRPHVFSWVIWGITTVVVFFAQLADRGGVGAWPVGLSGVITLYIATLAYARKGDSSITALDWVFLVLALGSLPVWYLAGDPLWAVVILTAIDLLGFGPTFRKAYAFPYEERLTLLAIMTARNLCVIAALEHYSATTVLFPAAIVAACLLFIFMVAYRRRAVTPC